MATFVYLFVFLVCLIDGTGAFIANKRSGESLTRRKLHEDRVSVALTREDGKNGKLIRALAEDLGSLIQMHELPCIEHADGPDFHRLSSEIESSSWDYVIVTSPEAAKVLASAWNEQVTHKVAAVGTATEETLEKYGIRTSYVPSKATAKVLVEELPGKEGYRVLYPASAQAKTTLEDGLRARGMEVTRLNTYDTVTATWTNDQKETAKSCRIACFASPSSVNGWLQNTNSNNEVLAACIGETSAEACRQNGWTEDRIFFPDKPGIEGWVEAVKEAMKYVKVKHT